MDIARYRATLQALTEARQSVVTGLLCDQVDDADLEQWLWLVQLLDSIERSARRTHVIANRVYLPGTKTRHARRIVTLTPRGVAAYQSIPRYLAEPLVFHTSGKPLDLHNWRSRIWYPALELAGLAPRGPYQLRHTFAYFSLLAGVPLADLSLEMGHESVRLTLDSYGHWGDEMGARAADLRATWASHHPAQEQTQLPA